MNVSRILQEAVTRELDRELYLAEAGAERRVRGRVADLALPQFGEAELAQSYVIGCELALRWAAQADGDEVRELAAPRTQSEELFGRVETADEQELREKLPATPRDPAGMRDDARLQHPVVKSAMRAALRAAAERELFEFDDFLARRGFLDTIEELVRDRRAGLSGEDLEIALGRHAARTWLGYASHSAWFEAVGCLTDENYRAVYPDVADDYREERRHVEREIIALLRRVSDRAAEQGLGGLSILDLERSRAMDAFLRLVAEQWEAADPRRRLLHIDAKLGADAARALLASLTDGQRNGLFVELVRANLTPTDLASEATFIEVHHPLPDVLEHALWKEEQESGHLNHFRFLLGFVEHVFSELEPAAHAEGTNAPE